MFRSNIKFFLAFFLATMLFAVVQVYAVWQDAPAAPAQYGTTLGTTQDDYKPVNLGSTDQAKTGGLNIMGNVGIGTTSPSQKLEVSSGYVKIKVKGTSSDAWVWADGFGNNNSGFQAGTDGTIRVQIDGALNQNSFFNTGGNVGIGTVSPYAKLQIDMQNLATTEGLHISRTSPTSYSYLNIEDQNSSPIFKVHQSGNVGIGTTTPGYKLDVAGAVNATDLCIDTVCKADWDAVVGSQDLQAVTDIGTSTTNVIGARAFYDSDDSSRNYFIDPFASGISAIFKGNVGIGVTTAPVYKLDVTGTIRANGGLIIDVRTGDPSSPVTGQMWLAQ